MQNCQCLASRSHSDWFPGIMPSGGRAIGFLEGDPQLDAGVVFDELEERLARTVRSRMDHWIAGNHKPAWWFHGFPNNPVYDQCFVFKWTHNRDGHRLYGFLCNPQPETNPRFRLCVLSIHATKNEDETDQAELDRVNQWRTNLRSREAIGCIYPEYKQGGNKGWNKSSIN